MLGITKLRNILDIMEAVKQPVDGWGHSIFAIANHAATAVFVGGNSGMLSRAEMQHDVAKEEEALFEAFCKAFALFPDYNKKQIRNALIKLSTMKRLMNY